MQAVFKMEQSRQAIRQMVLLVAMAILLGIAFNSVRRSPLPYLGDWSAGARMKTHSGENLMISLDAAQTLFKRDDVKFIDARDPEEFDKGHVKGAVNLPWHDVDNYFMEIAGDLDPAVMVITYCDGETCTLSRDLALFLMDMGFSNVRVLVDGWSLWTKNNLPVEAAR